MPVPYTFGTATAAIPLSQLDANFATPITIGNTAVQLGNTVTTLNNMTLANVTISSGEVTIGNVSVAGNVTLTGGTANGVAYLNGSKVLTTGSALVFDGTNLGVGTATPSYKLDVSSTAPTIASSGTTYLGSSSTVGASFALRSENTSSWTGTRDLISFDSVGNGADHRTGTLSIKLKATSGASTLTEYLQLNPTLGYSVFPSGNLGIGTTSPLKKLDVSVSTTASIGQYLRNSTINLLSLIDGTSSAQFGTETSHPLLFITGNIERARIDSSGNLLVGATATAAYFDGKVNSYSASSVPSFAGKQDAATAAVNVAWNAATSGDNIFEYFVTEASPTVRGGINYNRAAGLVVYATTSDYRAKEISGPVVNSGVLIDSVPVYMGTMKGATQERPMFIAHETPAYAHSGEKDAVDKDGNPVYQQMDTSALVPILWAEIQFLRKRLAAAGI